ncbi:MAG: FAD-binding oxidoreductase [Planctomycetes bacterium]|nr:FAD-binding oxidoreductase [Planctomycetota bacterium]
MSPDVVVVGGGIIGCAVLHALARVLPRSTRLLLLERDAIAGATSGSSMGHLMVTPDTPEAYSFTRTSVRLWAELAERTDGERAFYYRPTGALYLADSAEDLDLLPVLNRQFLDRGDSCEVVDERRLREIEPGLADDVPGALYYPGDGVVLPMLACSAMLREAMQLNPNVEVRAECPVTGFDVGGGRVTAVRTARGVVPTAHVVNATGVWAPELAEMLGQPRLPIWPRAGNLAITAHHVSPIRTQLLEIAYLRFAHGAAEVDPSGAGSDLGGHAVNMQPQSHGGCLIGSTRQFRGMDRTLNRELLHRSLLRAQRYAPSLAAAPIVRTWVGLRPYAEDGVPLIGPWPHVEGLWIAAGHEGLGISLAPITGLLLAQQIAGVAPAIDPTPYLPARFAA